MCNSLLLLINEVDGLSDRRCRLRWALSRINAIDRVMVIQDFMLLREFDQLLHGSSRRMNFCETHFTGQVPQGSILCLLHDTFSANTSQHFEHFIMAFASTYFMCFVLSCGSGTCVVCIIKDWIPQPGSSLLINLPRMRLEYIVG